MRKSNLNRHTLLVICTLIIAVAFFVQCIHHSQDKKISIRNAKGQEYIGAETCRSCHAAIYDSFQTAAHHLSSAEATPQNVLGSFNAGENVFSYGTPGEVMMEKEGDDLYQAAFINGKEERKERFDIVVGSGKRGQSYLFWKHGGLYQLPVSYFAKLDTWVNSPGFTTKRIYFDRLIESRCMECHATYAKEFMGEYRPENVMLGIDCEKCHGPGKEHVDFHTANKQEAQGKHILNTGRLTRQQRLDACALCHSGTMMGKTAAFSFMPGDTLSKHFDRNYSHIDSVNLDVHANQYGLLTASKCFIESKTMQCGTCHDPHVKERGDMLAYMNKCQDCHSPANSTFCSFKAPLSVLLSPKQCINCHMPVKESKNITLLTSGKEVPSSQPVRSHLIAVYREMQ